MTDPRPTTVTGVQQLNVTSTVDAAAAEPPPKLRHRVGRWFRDVKWFSRTALDERPYFEIVHCIQAKDMAEAEALWDAVADGLGCTGEGDDHVCPHFRFGALHRLDEGDV